MLDAARWSGAIFMATSTIILGLGTLRATRHGIAGLGASLTFACSAAILHAHARVMSEALFFMLCIGGIFAVVAYIATQKVRWLLFAALLIAGATFDRYIGLAATGATGLALLLIGPGTIRSRLMAASVVSLASIVPLAAWRLGIPGAAAMATGHLPSLAPEYLWARFEPLRGALVNYVWSWNAVALVLPGLHYGHMAILLFVAIVASGTAALAAVHRIRREHRIAWRHKPQTPVLLLTWLISIFYVAFFAFSFLLFRFELNIDQRLLSPLWLAIVLGTIASVSVLALHSKQKVLRWGSPILATLMFLIPAAMPTPALLSRLHLEGEGYSSPAWRQSGLVREAAMLPRDTAIITNESAAILFLIGRPCYDMTEIVDPGVQHQSGRFVDDLSDPAQSLFREGKAALVLFDSAYWQLWPKYEDQTQERLESLVDGLNVRATAYDGAIYFYP